MLLFSFIVKRFRIFVHRYWVQYMPFTTYKSPSVVFFTGDLDLTSMNAPSRLVRSGQIEDYDHAVDGGDQLHLRRTLEAGERIRFGVNAMRG
jgi:hypothetical protein